MWKSVVPVLCGSLLGVAGLLCLRTVAADAPGGVATGSAAVIAARRDAFREPEDGRTIARVDSRLVRRRGQVTLVLEVDARGPAVDPLPGLEGVAGANEKTASEIDALLAEDAITASVVLPSGRRLDGAVVPGEPTRLPARRLGSDGRIEFDARTVPYVAGFTIVVAGLAVGTHRLEVLARGEVRLTGTFHVEDGGGSLAGFTATGGLHRVRVGE